MFFLNHSHRTGVSLEDNGGSGQIYTAQFYANASCQVASLAFESVFCLAKTYNDITEAKH